MLIMFGYNWNPLEYFRYNTIAVLNLDEGSPILNAVLPSVLSQVSTVSGYNFDQAVLDPSAHSFASVERNVRDGVYWGALVINSGTTNRLLTAFENKTTNLYSPSGATTFIVDPSRGGKYIYATIQTWAGAAVASLSGGVSEALLTLAASEGKLLGDLAAGVISDPISFVFDSLREIPFPGVESICSFGPIVIYFVVNAHVAVVMKAHEPLKRLGIYYHHRLLALCFHASFGCIIPALWATLTVLWLGYTMSASTFFQFWAFIWLGMTAFATLFMMSFHVFGEAFGAMVNIAVYTLSVGSGGSSVPHSLQNPFWQIGDALPFYNIVTGLRRIFYYSGDGIGLNAGVMLIWIGLTFILAWRLSIRRRRVDTVVKFVREKSKKYRKRKASKPQEPQGIQFVEEVNEVVEKIVETVDQIEENIIHIPPGEIA